MMVLSILYVFIAILFNKLLYAFSHTYATFHFNSIPSKVISWEALVSYKVVCKMPDAHFISDDCTLLLLHITRLASWSCALYCLWTWGTSGNPSLGKLNLIKIRTECQFHKGHITTKLTETEWKRQYGQQAKLKENLKNTFI